MAIRASEAQRGTKLASSIRGGRILYGNTVYDYEPGRRFGILYFTLRGHISNPSYLYNRISLIKESDQRRETLILLLLDAEVEAPSLRRIFGSLQLDLFSFRAQILPVSSPGEGAAYIESMDAHDQGAPDRLRNLSYSLSKQKQEIRRVSSQEPSPEYVRKTLFLSSIPKITRSDATLLLSSKRSIKEALQASQITDIPMKGIGSVKRALLNDFLHKRFK